MFCHVARVTLFCTVCPASLESHWLVTRLDSSSSSFLSLEVLLSLLPSYWSLSFVLHQAQQYIFTQCTDIPQHSSRVTQAGSALESLRSKKLPGMWLSDIVCPWPK